LRDLELWGEGLCFPTHPGTTADMKESDPMQDVTVIFHDHSRQREDSMQAQEKVTRSPFGSPIIPVIPADSSGLGWRPPALQLCYSTTRPA